MLVNDLRLCFCTCVYFSDKVHAVTTLARPISSRILIASLNMRTARTKRNIRNARMIFGSKPPNAPSWLSLTVVSLTA